MLRALALLAPLMTLLAVGEQYKCERYGFSVEMPSSSWARYSTPEPEKSLFQVGFYTQSPTYLPCLVVDVDRAHDAKATALRDAAVKSLEARKSADIEQGESKIAGVDSAWVSTLTKTEGGADVLVVAHYLVVGDFVYVVQCGRAPGDDDAKRVLERMLGTFALFTPVISDEDAARAKLSALAERCWEVVDWQTTWAAAAARARAENKLVLVVYENMAVLAIPRIEQTDAFFDADFRALVERRFVPLRAGAKTAAPFRDPAAFGMSEHSFGSAYLFVTPDGNVLRETSLSDASVLYGIASDVLGGDPLAKDADELEGAAAHRARAAKFRRERDGASALDELHAARKLADDELAVDVAADEAFVLMKLERYTEARAAFERIVAEHPEHARAAEALFWLGAFEFLAKGSLDDTHSWRKLVETRPDDPWAWKAAANLLGEGSLSRGAERLDWPKPDAIAAATRPAREPLKREKATDAAHQACAYLIASQRDDGSWHVPAEDFGYSSDLYTTAIAALCATSLVDETGNAKARRAVEKTLAHVLELHKNGGLAKGEDLVATYSIWRRACALWLVAHCARAHIGDVLELREAMDQLAASVVASQHRGGGWPYVTFPDDPTAEHIDPSASFLTAGIVMILFDARDAGAKVPSAALDRALDFLARMREDDGTFQYMPASPGAIVDGSHPEAGGRGPLCALALHRGGRGDVASMRATLDIFLRHRGGFVSEWHKELCHTGPQGQGSHYLFYDYYFACAALAELPRKERTPYGDALANDVLAARFVDGSFEDMPSLGRAYATAMALLALRALDAR